MAGADVRVPVDRLRGQFELVHPRSWWASLWDEVRLRAGLITPAPGTRYKITAVAYSSSVGQTDLSPCVTAWQTRVRWGIVATNIFPFGTCFRVTGPEVDRVVRVEDRMNERYNGKFIMDVWHPTTAQARAFGSRLVEIEVLAACPAELLPPYERPPAPAPEDVEAATFVKELPPTALLPVPEEPPAGLLDRTRSGARRLWESAGFLGGRVVIPQEEDCLSS